ncbi:efflux RND transporter periplasmic adaptor subunit [Flavihumibacter sp. UBA7668]|uniref:efflux RND transporter periplasmic adaptor subunit n=1 Tax=Flavihumibacter sp. UBA7668 TaxID=1946542 RepID=UPI0025C53496|nr:efflux RND transporter periplasmic adaptor subunit [Flavihumibacter sp. UBA7668]
MKQFFVLSVLFAILTCTGCGHKAEEKEATTNFIVTQPLLLDTVLEREYVAQVRSIQHIELRAQERGYLQEIYIDEGQSVKKGQLLFKIMPQLYEAEAQKAKAEVEFAEIEYQNTQKLAESNIVSPNELAMAKARLNKAKAELNIKNVHLQFTNIYAPFNGIVDRFLVRKGSLLDEGELLTSLSDNSHMWVYFNVPEVEYLNLFNNSDIKNQQVELKMANQQIFPQKGKVETIEADFDNETGNISFRATFPNPKLLLRNGETGNILVKEELKQAILVPQKASFEVMDKIFVYVVDKENKVHTREIIVGAELEDLFVISSGLKAGDTILLEGIRKVQDGDKIQFQTEDPKAVLNSLKLPVQ